MDMKMRAITKGVDKLDSDGSEGCRRTGRGTEWDEARRGEARGQDGTGVAPGARNPQSICERPDKIGPQLGKRLNKALVAAPVIVYKPRQRCTSVAHQWQG